jgi:hypothetical protein
VHKDFSCHCSSVTAHAWLHAYRDWKSGRSAWGLVLEVCERSEAGRTAASNLKTQALACFTLWTKYFGAEEA